MGKQRLSWGVYFDYLETLVSIKYNLYMAKRAMNVEAKQEHAEVASLRAGDLIKSCPELGKSRLNKLSKLEKEAEIIEDSIWA